MLSRLCKYTRVCLCRGGSKARPEQGTFEIEDSDVIIYYRCHFVKCHEIRVLYPSLRVEIPEIKIESVRGFPPRLIRPMGMEPLDLEIDGDLSPLATAKGDGLAKLAPVVFL